MVRLFTLVKSSKMCVIIRLTLFYEVPPIIFTRHRNSRFIYDQEDFFNKNSMNQGIIEYNLERIRSM